MATTTAQAPQAPKASTGESPPPKAIFPISRDRVRQAAASIGDMVQVVLPNDDRIEEGPQDLRYWSYAGERMVIDQWVIVTNDAQTMWRLMRVAAVHGSSGAGLRYLDLRDIVPPRFVDAEKLEITGNGMWRWLWAGQHKRWICVAPNGSVRMEGFNSEREAEIWCMRQQSNPRPR